MVLKLMVLVDRKLGPIVRSYAHLWKEYKGLKAQTSSNHCFASQSKKLVTRVELTEKYFHIVTYTKESQA